MGKIVFQIQEEDKERFKEASKKLALTLSAFCKLACAEKSHIILNQVNKNAGSNSN